MYIVHAPGHPCHADPLPISAYYLKRYIKEEQKNLKRELLRAQEEVKRIQSVPLVIGQFLEMVDANNGIVGSTTGSNYYVRILSTLNRELLKPSASVALHRHSNALVDILPPEADSSISLLGDNEKPNITYQVGVVGVVVMCLTVLGAHHESAHDPCWATTSSPASTTTWSCPTAFQCLEAYPLLFALTFAIAPAPAPLPYALHRTSEAMTSRSRRSGRQWSCPSHMQGCTSSWALTRPAVCCCTGHQVRAKGGAGGGGGERGCTSS